MNLLLVAWARVPVFSGTVTTVIVSSVESRCTRRLLPLVAQYLLGMCVLWLCVFSRLVVGVCCVWLRV